MTRKIVIGVLVAVLVLGSGAAAAVAADAAGTGDTATPSVGSSDGAASQQAQATPGTQGALGKPVWMLDRFASCWRWRLDAERSPWYPTLRIFRQRRFGDWRDPVGRAAEALAAWRDARAHAG